jgi:hypothetical protein
MDSYLVRLEGGPLAGDRTHPGPWPLPGELVGLPDGRYLKVAESQLPEDFPGLMRGATYRWQPDLAPTKLAKALNDG